MFTIEQINAAHSKVRSGADFPNYIKEMKALGVTHYETYVSDGHTIYFGDKNYIIHSPAKYDLIEIQPVVKESEFKKGLLEHQKGLTDYPTFIQMCSMCGIIHWKVDISKMTCTYFADAEAIILEENIPTF